MEYYETIVKKRNSCRGFSGRKVEDNVLTELIKYYEEDESDLVDEIETELKFYVGTVWDELKKSVGYNGFCIKAPAYMVIYSEAADHYLENAGYIAQGLTLKLTELGLAACWQTVNDADEAKKALGEDTDKAVACVVAFGYRDPENKEKKAPKKSVDEMTDGYRFGQDMDISFARKNECIAQVNVAINNVFFAWLFGFDGKVMISGPNNVKDEFIRLVSRMMARL